VNAKIPVPPPFVDGDGVRPPVEVSVGDGSGEAVLFGVMRASVGWMTAGAVPGDAVKRGALALAKAAVWLWLIAATVGETAAEGKRVGRVGECVGIKAVTATAELGAEGKGVGWAAVSVAVERGLNNEDQPVGMAAVGPLRSRLKIVPSNEKTRQAICKQTRTATNRRMFFGSIFKSSRHCAAVQFKFTLKTRARCQIPGQQRGCTRRSQPISTRPFRSR